MSDSVTVAGGYAYSFNTADLSVAISGSQDPAFAGVGMAYTVTVSNAGPLDATGVVVSVTIPSSMSFMGSTPSQGSCGESGGTITCSLGSNSNGASVTVTVQVTPNAFGALSTSASVTADQADSNATNNSDTEQTQVGAAPGVPSIGTWDLFALAVLLATSAIGARAQGRRRTLWI